MLTKFSPCPACRGEGGSFDDYVEQSCSTCEGTGRVQRRFRVAPYCACVWDRAEGDWAAYCEAHQRAYERDDLPF